MASTFTENIGLRNLKFQIQVKIFKTFLQYSLVICGKSSKVRIKLGTALTTLTTLTISWFITNWERKYKKIYKEVYRKNYRTFLNRFFVKLSAKNKYFNLTFLLHFPCKECVRKMRGLLYNILIYEYLTGCKWHLFCSSPLASRFYQFLTRIFCKFQIMKSYFC